MKIFGWLVVACVACMPLGLCDITQWKIGIVISDNLMTSIADSAINASLMAVQDVNAQGLLPGITLSAVHLNSMSNQYMAVQNGINLANTSGVVGVVGELLSSMTSPLALVTKNFNLPQCSGSATLTTLSDKSTYTTFFRTLPPDNFQGPAIANYIYSNNWRNVILIYSSDTYGTSLMQSFQSRAQALGINIQISMPYNTPASSPSTFSGIASRIQSSSYRIVVILGYDSDMLLYLQLASNMGLVGPSYVYVGSDGLSSIVSEAQPSDLANLPGIVYLSALESGGNSVSQSLNSRFHAAYGQYPEANSLFFYDWYDAGSLHNWAKPFLGAYQSFLLNRNINTVQNVYSRQANLSFSTFLTNFTGATGSLTFTSTGDRVGPYGVTNLQRSPNGGGINSPLQTQVISQMVMSYSNKGPLALVIVYSIGECRYVVAISLLKSSERSQTSLAFSIASFLVLIIYRENPIVQQMSLPFLLLINVFANLLVKVYRIYRIFDNPRMKIVKLSNLTLMGMSFVLVAVNIAIITAWNVIDPLSPVRVTTSSYWYLDCQSSSPLNQMGFSYSLLAYNGLLLLASTYLAYKTRNVSAQYRESNWIAYCGLFIILCGSVVIILLLSTNDYVGTYYLRLGVIALGTVVTYYCLIGRVILTIISDILDAGLGTSKGPSSAGGVVETTAYFGSSSLPRPKFEGKRVFDVKLKSTTPFSEWKKARIKLFDRDSILCLYTVNENVEEKTKSGKCCRFQKCLVSFMNGKKALKFAIGNESYSMKMSSEIEREEFMHVISQARSTTTTTARPSVVASDRGDTYRTVKTQQPTGADQE
ncbi:periplasmic binding protein-like I [Polychytrium aggregatum]|uniref:periplasmic binding protein-like I n=1 Tax=Polychytrium aggregatum TaxID=110093 RepID=UPI0022FE48EA|nr:periplasmic binding protein-like I [Polychytrium aggregatum]KAI9203071.1 periplasmic binding protein-like I [Polychytrium aggregatum]